MPHTYQLDWGETPMKIIKRNGSEVDFNASKIIKAMEKANITVTDEQRLTLSR